MSADIHVESESKPKVPLGNDKSASDLLEATVLDMVAGRPRAAVVKDLMKCGWEEQAAAEFSRLAAQIAQEIRTSPEERRACARKGMERLQAAGGWVVSGIVIFALMYSINPTLRGFSPFSLLIVGYGLVELMAGLALYWPHREFMEDSVGSGPRGPTSGPKLQ